MTLDEIYNNVLDKTERVEMLYQMLIVACNKAGLPAPATPFGYAPKKVLAAAISKASYTNSFIEVIKVVRKAALEIEMAGFPVNSELKEAKEFSECLFDGRVVRGMTISEVESWLETHHNALHTILL